MLDFLTDIKRSGSNASPPISLSRLQARYLIVLLFILLGVTVSSFTISSYSSSSLPSPTNYFPDLKLISLPWTRTVALGVIPLDAETVIAQGREYLLTASVAAATEDDEDEDRGIVHLVLPTVASLHELQPLICNLVWTGHDVQVIVLTLPLSSQSEPRPGLCEIPYNTLPRSADVHDFLTDLWREIQPDVVFVGHYDRLSTQLWDSILAVWDLRPIVIPLGEEGDTGELWDWAGTLSLSSLQSWHIPRIDIAIIANDRPESLQRLMTSVLDARYLSDEVHITYSLERTATIATQQLVRDFVWPQGTITVRHRVKQGGLVPQIIESWYPKDMDSYGVILEDDIEVSPMFYSWAKWAILKYRYDKTERKHSRGLYGVSLYQQNHSEMQADGPKRIPFDARKVIEKISGKIRSSPYLSQIPCSWGAVYFPEVWVEFHSFLPLRQASVGRDTNDGIIPRIRTNTWFTSWKRFMNELIYLRGYSMLYPNYDDWLSLSTNHFEPGEHHRVTTPAEIAIHKEQLMYFDVPLFPAGLSLMKQGMPNGTMPDWADLAVLDFWGKVRTEKELRDTGRRRHKELFPQMSPPTLEADENPWQPEFLASSLLCKPDSVEVGCSI